MNKAERTCFVCGTKYTEEAWDKLPGAGRNNMREHLQTTGVLFEYRNCPCGGTMVEDVLPPVLSLLETLS